MATLRGGGRLRGEAAIRLPWRCSPTIGHNAPSSWREGMPAPMFLNNGPDARSHWGTALRTQPVSACADRR